MAKVTQVDFPPREIVSYAKETQTPVVTQEKEGESLLTLARLAGTAHTDAEPDSVGVFSTAEVNAEHPDEGEGDRRLSGKSRMSPGQMGCPCDRLYYACRWRVALACAWTTRSSFCCCARFSPVLDVTLAARLILHFLIF